MNKHKQIEAAAQSLRDEVRILSHPPGSVRRAIEIDLIAERKRDEAKRRAKKLKAEKPVDHKVFIATADELAALHAVKTAHGLLKSVHGKLPPHLQDPKLSTGRSQSGEPDWKRRGFTVEEVRRVRGGRRGTREFYLGTNTLRIVDR
jgi:hypothetical protein